LQQLFIAPHSSTRNTGAHWGPGVRDERLLFASLTQD